MPLISHKASSLMPSLSVLAQLIHCILISVVYNFLSSFFETQPLAPYYKKLLTLTISLHFFYPHLILALIASCILFQSREHVQGMRTLPLFLEHHHQCYFFINFSAPSKTRRFPAHKINYFGRTLSYSRASFVHLIVTCDA